MVKCACGCGQDLNMKWFRKNKPLKYIHGHNKPRQGKTITEETRLKISNTLKGIKPKCAGWNKGIKCPHISKSNRNRIPWNKGKKGYENNYPKNRKGRIVTEETRKKISKTNTGKKRTEEFCENIKKRQIGCKHSLETKKRMRESHIEYMKETSNFNCPALGKYETVILDNLEKCLTYTILRQYRTIGYFLDGYCPALNLAIEVDEPKHQRKEVLERDTKRQQEIEQELSCQFLRINVLKGEY